MREAWIDRWKGMLILLVVIGHVVGGAAHLTTSGISLTLAEGVYRVIYLFHMVAFFAVAGYCWKAHGETFCEFASRKARRLLIPYAVFGMGSVIVYLIMRGQVLSHVGSGVGGYYTQIGGEPWWQPFLSLLHAGGWPHGEGFRANNVLWFLPCLFVANLTYWWIDRLVPRRLWQLVLAVVFTAIAFFIRRHVRVELPWGIEQMVFYMPFVIAGRWLIRPLLETQKAPSRGLVVLASVIFIVVGWQMPSQWFGQTDFLWYLAFVGMAMWGIVMSATLVRLFPCLGLEILGAISLTVMLVHKFPVVLLEVRCPMIHQLLAGNVWMMMLGELIVAVVACVAGWGVHMVMRRWMPWAIGVVQREGTDK